jgi:hypothetical protein
MIRTRIIRCQPMTCALLGVLPADPKATEGIVTTTSTFAPRITRSLDCISPEAYCYP